MRTCEYYLERAVVGLNILLAIACAAVVIAAIFF